MKGLFFLFRVVAVIIVSFSPLVPAVAQVGDAGKPQKDQPMIKFQQHGWGPNGELVLAIRVHASPTKPLELGSFTETETSAFSLEDGYLVDLYTEQRFEPLKTLIQKPYFGPPGMVATLEPKGWIQLGVAFPPVPKPPSKDGKVLPYKLRFHPPGGIPPVTFEIPFDPNAKAAR